MPDIQRLDLHDEGQLAAFDRVYLDASREGRPYATPWPLPERRAAWLMPSTTQHYEGWLYVTGDEVQGVAEIELPLLDNTHVADVSIYVPARFGRRGVGTALAEHIAHRLRAEGRRVVQAFISGAQIIEGGVEATSRSPGEAFATRLGLTNRLVNIHRVLALPLSDQRLRQLAEQAAVASAGYRLVSWVDSCPAEHVDAYCLLKAALLEQVPMGDLEFETEVWGEARLRERESELVAMGRTMYVQVAVAPDGNMVGHTEIVVPRHDPEQLFQWDTLVLPEHRGHRLGITLKVANHVAVQFDHPDRLRAHTWNAADNPPMVAVNDALGYRPVEFVGEWQGPVPA